jgi:hypothetical protein
MQYNLQGELTIMDNLEIKPNYAALGRKYNMDWRTVKKYHEGYKGKPRKRNKPSKLDLFNLNSRCFYSLHNTRYYSFYKSILINTTAV